MAHLIRPIRQLSPQFHHHIRNLLNFLPKNLPHSPTPTLLLSPSFSTVRSPPHRRKLRPSPQEALTPTITTGNDSDTDNSDSDSSKSRNQRKREARQAVKWGIELSSFSSDQIKRILRAVSLGEEVYDALMLAKRINSDVREGRRRHFNYIGKLLRDVEGDLMDTLINATRQGDHVKIQELINLAKDDEDVGGGADEAEIKSEQEVERSEEYMGIAGRWFDGLISQNVEITNEVYSLQNVDFDRQELRKLVRKVQLVYEERKVLPQEKQKEVDAAEKSLNRFLCFMAKQMQSEQADIFV